ncbi:hypothetical protein COBT_002695 [Conglomerata obtusa]
MTPLQQSNLVYAAQKEAQQDIDDVLNQLSDKNKKLFKDINFSECFADNALINAGNAYIDEICDTKSAKLTENFRITKFNNCVDKNFKKIKMRRKAITKNFINSI